MTMENHQEPIKRRKSASTGGFNVLGAPQAQKRLNRIKTENPSRFGLFERVYSGKHTRNQAIKAQCLECVGFDSVAVRECGDRLCPLWKFRPFQAKEAS